MLRLVTGCLYIIVLWSGLPTVVNGQEALHLAVNPDRLKYAREVERQARIRHDSLLLAEAWYLYGKMYVMAGDYHASQNYFLKSLRIHEPRGYSAELSRLYFRLSENERRFGRFREALYYANLSLKVAQQIRSDKALIRSYGGLGAVYESIWNGQVQGHQAEYNRIFSYYRKAEELCYKINDSMGVAEANVKLGTLFIKAKSEKAIPHLKKAVYLFTLKDKEGIRVTALVHLASAYMNARQFKLAGQALVAAEQLYDSRKLNDYDIRVVLESKCVDYYKATGQWKTALARLTTLNEMQRNQLIADRHGAVTRLNVEYETEKKVGLLNIQKKELALRAETLQTQRRFTLAVSALLVLAVGMSFVFFKLYRKNQRISLQNQELVKEQNHRVKNNLQVVSSLLSLQSKRLTDEAAKKAIEESRLRVESMAILHRRLYDGDKLARVNADEFIRELVGGALKAYGFYAIETEFRIDSIELSADKAVPLGLILNELTTNACKYAFPHAEHPHYLIHGKRHKQTIVLTVTDNGPGWADTRLDGPGLDGPGWADTRLDDAQMAGERYRHVDVLNRKADVLTVKKTSLGMQLIQAQVEQLHGTGQFSTTTNGTGLTFTMQFNV